MLTIDWISNCSSIQGFRPTSRNRARSSGLAPKVSRFKTVKSCSSIGDHSVTDMLPVSLRYMAPHPESAALVVTSAESLRNSRREIGITYTWLGTDPGERNVIFGSEFNKA